MCFRPMQVQTPIRCPECGAMNPFNRDTCKKCKAELPKEEMPMVKCPDCGTESLPDSEFCTECGLTGERWDNAVMNQLGVTAEQIAEARAKASGLAPTAPGGAAPSAPGMPSAPGAPKPPSAPSAPTAPKMPSAPTGPKSPSA